MTKSSWLITGGSSGLGLSLGRAILQKGSTAVLTTRSLAKAREAAPDIEKDGGKWLQLDFDSPNVEQLVKDAATQWGIDVVVNNAGYAAVGPVESLSPDSIRKQYEANLFGPLRIIQAVLPMFRQRQSGTIINIGSSVSYTGHPGLGVYGSTKAALRTVTEGLTAELASFGIRVLLFELGRFRTSFGAGVVFPDIPEVYKDTVVNKLLTGLQSAPPAPGNPDEAASRIYEVVTRTGAAADEKVRDRTRFPLGSDANGHVHETAKNWHELAEATEIIATSTDFKE